MFEFDLDDDVLGDIFDLVDDDSEWYDSTGPRSTPDAVAAEVGDAGCNSPPAPSTLP